MPKKTARHQPVPRKVARAKENLGLIAKAEKARRSARTKSALDNRSHRTIALIEQPGLSCKRSNETRSRQRTLPKTFCVCQLQPEVRPLQGRAQRVQVN